MRKIMFFDIDGTLIPEEPGGEVPESTVKALELARTAGSLLFINTGRPLCNVNTDITSLGFDGYVCGCGTNIFCEGKEISYTTVSRELCLETVELLRECDAVPMYERRDCVLFDIQSREMPMIRAVRDDFAAQGKDVSHSTEDKDFSFDKFIICYDERSDIARLRPEIERHFFWIDRGEGFAEIVPKPCSKAYGITAVLSYYGIDKSDAYAIGDSLNDLPMFDAVGTGIAMGNGKMLIPYAGYVTDDIHHDGVYKAMEHFGFFGEDGK
ncbi:MAG: HAD-IIB family hydrolase [Ruminococcus sp.]|nr:HAD-IIB family hydrolase [Ruminococcus sp.]